MYIVFSYYLQHRSPLLYILADVLDGLIFLLLRDISNVVNGQWNRWNTWIKFSFGTDAFMSQESIEP